MKEVVFINQDSGYLMIDIVNAFAGSGYDTVLLSGRLVERNKPLSEGVVYKKISPYNRNSLLSRFFSWNLGFFQILFKLWFRYRGAHLFIVSNPPFAPLIPLFCSNHFTLLFYDVYIETPKGLPIIRRFKILINLWINAHVKVLKKATQIFTLTDGMKKSLERYCGNDRVRVVPVWTDNSFLKPVRTERNPFVAKHEITEKFVVLYSGNLGASSGVETLIDVAHTISETEILFLIIGDGLRKETLVKKAKGLGLENCMFLPWQDPATLPFSLASANLAVVSLVGKASQRSIPSKLYNYMSVGSPVLCIADSDSDLAATVSGLGAGQCFEPQNLPAIREYIIQMASNPELCKEFSRKSLLASKSFTPENAMKFLPQI